MTKELAPRRQTARRLVVDAATSPVNVVVPAAVVGSAFLLDAIWLVPIAVVVYLGMAAETFFKGRAERHGRGRSEPAVDMTRLPTEIARPLEAAKAEAGRIREVLDGFDRPLPEVGDEVDALIADTYRIARRAQFVHDYLTEQDADEIERKLAHFRREVETSPGAASALRDAIAAHEEHLRVIRELEEQLVRLAAELEHLGASLSVVRGQLLRVGAAEDTLMDHELGRELRELRSGVGGLADAMVDAFSPDEARAPSALTTPGR